MVGTLRRYAGARAGTKAGRAEQSRAASVMSKTVNLNLSRRDPAPQWAPGAFVGAASRRIWDAFLLGDLPVHPCSPSSQRRGPEQHHPHDARHASTRSGHGFLHHAWRCALTGRLLQAQQWRSLVVRGGTGSLVAQGSTQTAAERPSCLLGTPLTILSSMCLSSHSRSAGPTLPRPVDAGWEDCSRAAGGLRRTCCVAKCVHLTPAATRATNAPNSKTPHGSAAHPGRCPHYWTSIRTGPLAHPAAFPQIYPS